MINFKHLHYFLIVAKEGSIAKASKQLHITPQTISGQLSLLESNFSEKLFLRVGRSLELTETGRLVLSYANDIFSLGDELEEIVKNSPTDRQLSFKVGITDAVPKSIAYRLLAPALSMPMPVRMICKEGSIHSLLSDLAVHKLDLIIADEPIPLKFNIRGKSHILGESSTSFFATPRLAKSFSKDFPECLNGAPLLLAEKNNTTRTHLTQWLNEKHIYPRVIGEFDDSALMKAFGQGGAGVFITPTAISKEVMSQYGVVSIGQTEDIKEQFYSITVPRKWPHPAISSINETAREWLSH